MTPSSTLRLAVLCVLPGLMGCFMSTGTGPDMTEIERPTASEWDSFTSKRIVFGHQSVGFNILDGLHGLAADHGVELRIEETRKGGQAHVTHFRIGTNGEPLAKLTDFLQALTDGASAGADIAMMKLCYVDFGEGTEPHRVAAEYIRTLEELEAAHPSVTFVAITAPLTTVQVGPKAWVKKLLGRQPAGYEDNARRQQFNDALRARFAQQGRLFDLARIESGDTRFAKGKDTYEALDSRLTDDGGHLNDQGSRLVASALVKFLAIPLPPAP